MATANNEQMIGRKGRTSYTSTKLWARRNKRSEEAAVRQDKYDSLTLKEKLAKVTNRGGSVKELARLTAALKASKKS